MPLVVSVGYQDGSSWKGDYSAGEWEGNRQTVKIPNWKQVTTLEVNSGIPDANILDNFYPSLPQRYGDFSLSEEFYGEYAAKEYPVSIVISNKDDLVYIALAGTGMGSYMMPNGGNTLESLAKDMILSLDKKEDGKVAMSLELKNFGVTLTGDKK